MRVSRAVDKLRKQFKRRGFVLSVGALTAHLSAHAAQAAPASCVSAAAALGKVFVAGASAGTAASAGGSAAVAGASGSAASIKVAALFDGVSRALFWSQAKTVTTVGVATVLAGTAVAQVAPLITGAPPPAPQVTPSNVQAPLPATLRASTSSRKPDSFAASPRQPNGASASLDDEQLSASNLEPQVARRAPQGTAASENFAEAGKATGGVQGEAAPEADRNNAPEQQTRASSSDVRPLFAARPAQSNPGEFPAKSSLPRRSQLPANSHRPAIMLPNNLRVGAPVRGGVAGKGQRNQQNKQQSKPKNTGLMERADNKTPQAPRPVNPKTDNGATARERAQSGNPAQSQPPKLARGAGQGAAPQQPQGEGAQRRWGQPAPESVAQGQGAGNGSERGAGQGNNRNAPHGQGSQRGIGQGQGWARGNGPGQTPTAQPATPQSGPTPSATQPAASPTARPGNGQGVSQDQRALLRAAAETRARSIAAAHQEYQNATSRIIGGTNGFELTSAQRAALRQVVRARNAAIADANAIYRRDVARILGSARS